jgi:bromodomain-containing protein 7/9
VEEEEQEAVVDVTVAHPRKPCSSQEDDGDDDDNDDDEEGEKPTKKRRLNAVAAVNGSRQSLATDSNHVVPAGSGIRRCSIKAEKQIQNPEVTEPVADATSDPLSETPMPENGLLEFILDKLQKKDTYGVFAKPVDPNELPDYHEIIKNPMDFGTIRKKLAKGAYACFEQFEKDVLLISTNAMHYNASDTIYYKQARAIQELARKKFQGIRLDPEGIEVELRLASKAKSGFSSKKLTRKPGIGRSQFESAGSDFSSGATLATVGDHAIRSSAPMQDSTKTWKAEKPGNVFGNSDGMGFLAESNSEKAEEHSVSALKQSVWRNGRRPLQFEENRRATYRPFNQLENGNDSILTILDGESKQLIPVGIRAEHAYARSLARFSANLGPVAWKIAAQKIRRALPPGVSFGPGWVSDYEAPPRALLSHEGKSGALLASCTTLPIVPGETKVKSNNCEDTPRLRDQGLPKNLISEGRSVPSTMAASSARQLVSNSDVCQVTDNCQSIRDPQSEVIGHGALNSTGDGRVSLPSQEVKQGLIKPVLPVTTSNDLALTGTKFGSEVTQSRLLEMVSRNSTLMHGASLKQADGSRSIASLQVMKSETIAHDSDVRTVARKASDASKRGCSSPGTNVAVTAVNSSLGNYQAGSRVLQAHQITSSQEHAKQDLNGLANLLPGKMLALHQRGSNLSANTPVFVHSSVSSTGPSIKRDDAAVQAWIQSQNARLADADATTRVRLQDASNPHMEQHESQARDFSTLARFMPQEMPLDTSRQALSQFSRFHPQNSMKVSNNTAISGPVTESQGRNIVTPSHVQKPVGVELSKSNNHLWRGLPSQFLPEQDLSPSLPPDLNVRFQKSNSPAQQSSAMLADSQQPDLALQL